MSTEKIELIKLKLLLPSEGNRPNGSGMSAKSIGELADSIKEKGVRQPLIVREHPDHKGKYEVTNGHRRLAAAEKLGLTELPCIIRTLTDLEAKEERIIENLQREGLHEIEEARLYQELLDEQKVDGTPAYDIKLIGTKIGKSPAFVYARVKLLRMPPLAQEAFIKGRLNASVALLLCRIPDPKLAHKATCEVLSYSGKEEDALKPESEAKSYRSAKWHIEQKYMKRLKDAPFNQEDALLVPPYAADGKTYGEAMDGAIERAGGGICSACPHRTGVMKKLYPALYVDLESADVCTNPACYQLKVKASEKKLAAEAKANGQTLLKPKEADRVLNYEGTELNDRARQKFVALNEQVPGKRKTWGELIEKAGVEHEVVVAKGKKTVHLVPINEALVKAAEDAGVELELPKGEPTDEEIAADKAAQEAKRAVLEAALVTVCEQLSKNLRQAKYADEVRAQVGADLLSNGGNTVTQKQVRKMDDQELFAELFMNNLYSPMTYGGDLRPEYIKTCAEFGVDVKAIVKEAQAAAKAEAKPEKK